MKKIVSILGARPQFIKAAVLSRIIRNEGEFDEVIIHTGQHFDANMSEVFFNEMEIPKPKYNLDINGLGHGGMTGRMLEGIENILLKERPDLVIVYGDTNSTLAGALAARKLDIKIVHVEAGLRSFNMSMPEEVNRILTDRISDLLFCPTENAVLNLRKEGYDNLDLKVLMTGDVMKDSVAFYGELSESKSRIIEELNLTEDNFILATLHRQENTDDPDALSQLIQGLNEIHKNKKVVLPVHPRTKSMMSKQALDFEGQMIDPVGYFDMLQLLKNCSLVITDSGGLQKEAYFNNKPCVITRKETEWIELVKQGYARIVGADAAQMKSATNFYLDESLDFKKNLYGDAVGQKMYEAISEFLKKN